MASWRSRARERPDDTCSDTLQSTAKTTERSDQTTQQLERGGPAYAKVQRAMAMLKSAVYDELLDASPRGLRNVDIGRNLGIYGGMKVISRVRPFSARRLGSKHLVNDKTADGRTMGHPRHTGDT